MSTYTQILYQLVFSTKDREPTLTKNNSDKLYRYIGGVLKNKKCHLYRIGGVEDHVHIITHIHPSVALASLIKDIKLSSTSFIKSQKLFTSFNDWQSGYGAFTYNIDAKDNLIDYVKNQESHHKKEDFKEEYMQLLKQNGVEFDKKYLL